MSPLHQMARVLEIGEQIMDGDYKPLRHTRSIAGDEWTEREAAQDAAEHRALKVAWDELREKLTARMNHKLPLGMRARGRALVQIEDADAFLTEFLNEVKP